MAFRESSRSMWSRALQIMEQSERLHRQIFQLGRRRLRGPTWEPPVDVYERSDALTVLVALPGVQSNQLNVVVDGGMLHIVGERNRPLKRQSAVRRLEIPYGRFERYVDLPSGHFEIGERELANGCLRLVLNKLA